MGKEGEPRRVRLTLTAAVKMDYPSAAEIGVSFADEWELVEQLRRGDVPLYIAALPDEQERPSRDHFPDLAPEINLELNRYRLHKFFLAWPMPSVTVAWDDRTDSGRVVGEGSLKVQLQPIGQAQAWFGQRHAVLWEAYMSERWRGANWQDELAAIWRIVEHDIGASTIFSMPHDPAFAEGYKEFLARLGYGPDPDAPRWWSKTTA